MYVGGDVLKPLSVKIIPRQGERVGVKDPKVSTDPGNPENPK